MAIRSLVAQDRRRLSRISTRLACRCALSGISRDAVILNLSLNGAYISASFRPPIGSTVTLTLETPVLKNALVLESRVIRVDQVTSQLGVLNRFGVQFNRNRLDLVTLINKLALEQPQPGFRRNPK